MVDEVEACAVLEERQRQVVVNDADKLVVLDNLGESWQVDGVRSQRSAERAFVELTSVASVLDVCAHRSDARQSRRRLAY